MTIGSSLKPSISPSFLYTVLKSVFPKNLIALCSGMTSSASIPNPILKNEIIDRVRTKLPITRTNNTTIKLQKKRDAGSSPNTSLQPFPFPISTLFNKKIFLFAIKTKNLWKLFVKIHFQRACSMKMFSFHCRRIQSERIFYFSSQRTRRFRK